MELPDGDHVLAQDSDGPILSRKDKGKGKEKAAVRIKE